ncbi:unnamed protein product [Coffea canephora]|uniref:Uncharacterized protein n=1 Tax=Coffea canephora TaxID=49390 RepID=A0A068TQ14_COFCA|nr:unnamed protein product [Coffea canephora]
MASVPCSDISNSVLCKSRAISLVGLSSFPLSEPKAGGLPYLSRDRVISQGILRRGTLPYIRRGLHGFVTKKVTTIPRSNISSNSSDGSGDDSSDQDKACLISPITSILPLRGNSILSVSCLIYL